MSLVPDAVRAMKSLSAGSVHGNPSQVANPNAPARRRSALDRRQVELVAGRVSALNECFY